MNKYVSLLPVEYKSKLAEQQKLAKISKSIAGVAFVLCICLLGVLGNNALISSQTKNLNEQTAQVNSIVATYGDLEQLQQDMNILKAKVALVRQLDLGWISVIYNITTALPNGVWLQSVSTAPITDLSQGLVLECNTTVYSNIASAIQSLEALDSVSTAVCTQSSQVSQAGGSPTVKFTLTVNLAGTTPPVEPQPETAEAA